jgi:Spy/CpxP family protein refolding chaperone
MRPLIKETLCLSATLALITALAATANAQNEGKENPPAKPGGEAGMGQMMDGQRGMT